MKKENKTENWVKEKATDVVDMFLSILSPWFHPDDKWERIEKTANEFLFEGIVSELKSARQATIQELLSLLEGKVIGTREGNAFKEDAEIIEKLKAKMEKV